MKGEIKALQNSCEVGIQKSSESLTHKLWRKGIIKDDRDTSIVVEKALIDIRCAKSKIEELLNSTRQLLDTWNNYSFDYKQACKRLGDRIAMSEEKAQIADLLREKEEKLRNKHKRETLSFRMKKNTKIRSITTRRAFGGY